MSAPVTMPRADARDDAAHPLPSCLAASDSGRRLRDSRRPALRPPMKDTGKLPLPEPLLEVRDLRIGFVQGGQRSEAVSGVSFELYPGETLALVGEIGLGQVGHRALDRPPARPTTPTSPARSATAARR